MRLLTARTQGQDTIAITFDVIETMGVETPPPIPWY
jgi:hypothetical protein